MQNRTRCDPTIRCRYLKYLSTTCALLGLTALLVAEEAAPEELLRIKTEHRDKIESVTRPVNEHYIRELERLKENLTRSGDLDGALQVDRELHRARAVGEWQWSNAGNALTFWLRADGTFITSEDDKIGSWTISEGKLHFWDLSLSFADGKWTGRRGHDDSSAELKPK